MQRERESPRMNMDLADAEKDALVEPIDPFIMASINIIRRKR